MNRGELIKGMQKINIEHGEDKEAVHIEMDKLLLEFIGDEIVNREFNKYTKWYS